MIPGIPAPLSHVAPAAHTGCIPRLGRLASPPHHVARDSKSQRAPQLPRNVTGAAGRVRGLPGNGVPAGRAACAGTAPAPCDTDPPPPFGATPPPPHPTRGRSPPTRLPPSSPPGTAAPAMPRHRPGPPTREARWTLRLLQPSSLSPPPFLQKLMGARGENRVPAPPPLPRQSRFRRKTCKTQDKKNCRRGKKWLYTCHSLPIPAAGWSLRTQNHPGGPPPFPGRPRAASGTLPTPFQGACVPAHPSREPPQPRYPQSGPVSRSPTV